MVPEDAFEVAEWVLGSLLAWCSARADAERAKADPDPARLAEIATERAEFARLWRSLSVRQRLRQRSHPREER